MPPKKIGPRQIELLLEFAETHRDIAMGRFGGGPMGNQASRQAWETIALRLNSVADGLHKTPEQWRRTPVETASTASTLHAPAPQQSRQEDNSFSSALFDIGEASSFELGSPAAIPANERVLPEASPEVSFQQIRSPPEDHSYSQRERARRRTQRSNQDVNVPSWAYELELRRLAVEEQHAAALVRIAEAVHNIENTLARIARVLEARTQ